MKNKDFLIGRRTLFKGLIAVAAVPAVTACSQTEFVHCVNPSSLKRKQQKLRASLKYIDISEHEERCLDCSFYSNAPSAGCGQCRMLNSPVSDKGWCPAWSK